MQCPGCRKGKRGDNCQACFLAEARFNRKLYHRLNATIAGVSYTRLRAEIIKLAKTIDVKELR